MKNFNEMGKKELRAECKEAGMTGYSKLTVGAMRELLSKHQAEKVAEKVEVEVPAVEAPVVGEFTHCPHCDEHLNNGWQENSAEYKCETHQFACLACGGEFGPELKPTGTGIKIEKDRPEKNGVVRPSEGGKCRAIWDACEAYYAKTKMIPMPKQMKEIAKENGWNENNAVIEMYQWRKFCGFKGRQS